MGAISKTINYQKISEGQKEFQRSDYWMMSFVRIPSGVYFPGQELLDIRCNSFDPGIEDDPNIMEQKIRGFVSKQASRPDQVAGSATMVLKDRADQSLSYFVDQWKLAGGDRDSLQGLPKELYTADLLFTLYDISETPIRSILLINCMPPTGGLGEEGTEEPGLMPDLSISLGYEHFKRQWLNK